ncbi:hypothetical protein Rsub_00363 [Raphidocelis subcapitata]|uniref:RRM domain-containing protein n=1 Tax=Raphidocelis subcapitata TaxID=307507 RepID=A0A2V0NMK9_9CHLO|nr:hypothetical protein Rsub_00363 [Raphidocelis subcapitata]|eukprot:GBF87652.1 hypothetical protein Rsub_00363 [Raphidocelis subcapitata]
MATAGAPTNGGRGGGGSGGVSGSGTGGGNGSGDDELEVNAVCAEPKLFLGGLRYDVTPDDVRAHYGARFGALRSVLLLTHSDTGKSKGCALALLESWAAAEEAVAAEHGAVTPLTQPRPGVVKFADPQRNDHGLFCGITPKKLFIGQVPPDVTEDQIRAIFQPFGSITDFNIMPPRKPGSMGCAFVTYSSWAEAEAALAAVNGNITLPGSAHPMAVKFADAKPTELAKFEARGARRSAPAGEPAGAPASCATGASAAVGAGPGPGAVAGGGFAPTPPQTAASGSSSSGLGGNGSSSSGSRQQRVRGPGNPMMMVNPMMMPMGYPGYQAYHPQGYHPGYPHPMMMMVNPMMMAGMQGMPITPMGMPTAAMAPMRGGGPGLMAALPPGPAATLAAAKAWKLFVGQISFDLTEEQLFPFFSQYGTILELALPRTDGRSRGYAFLTYSNQGEAVAALEAANGAVVPGDAHARPLTVRWAENRSR